ncbi:T6SS phospholipase effector Tle1-like catalytic domain-containing protein [Massilia consociata]|uniref:T6SS phospholipase effector Tle1-like catalytic domain-containing protein n=1 Tax=Massilia consociata TaxID=760117 RepID=A0ABV6FK32_9BURK
MSASLSTPAGPEFENSARYEIFFNDAENKALKKLRARESTPICSPKNSCDTNLFFGFFFDGTGNNYIAAEKTKSHSNVARLYDCFPGMSVPGVLPKSTDWEYKSAEHKHFFRVYIPGVGTAFPQVRDSGAATDKVFGGASGRWGERRIIWALVQAINNVHRFFLGSALVSPSELENLFGTLSLTCSTRWVVEGRHGPDADVIDSAAGTQTKYILSRLLTRLHQAVAQHWLDKRTGMPAKKDPGIVRTIYISIFGFSRGATQARAFANWLHSLCRLDAQLCGAKRMSLGGFPVEFDFLGIFDTVASVGMGNGVAALNGHGAWADAEDSLRIPAGLKCLHLVAAHELRRSFPLDSISVDGAVPAGCKEIVVPGVHSDIGGGYCPREQGRGTHPNGDDMLSRIPLIMMYKAARLSGTPLKLELATDATKAKFAVSKETIQSFNAYLDTCKEKQGPLHRIVREHMRKQVEWRVHRRVSGKAPLQDSGSFLRASAFHQNELHSAALEFDDEVKAFLAWMQSMGSRFKPSLQRPGFGDLHHAEWEEIATFWHALVVPCAATADLFDNYVHDSRASFRLSGPANEQEMHDYLRRRVRQREQAMAVAARTGEYRLMLTPDEERAADEYARTNKLPRFRIGGREPWNQSFGILSRGGYLRYRKIYSGSDTALIS